MAKNADELHDQPIPYHHDRLSKLRQADAAVRIVFTNDWHGVIEVCEERCWCDDKDEEKFEVGGLPWLVEQVKALRDGWLSHDTAELQEKGVPVLFVLAAAGDCVDRTHQSSHAGVGVREWLSLIGQIDIKPLVLCLGNRELAHGDTDWLDALNGSGLRDRWLCANYLDGDGNLPMRLESEVVGVGGTPRIPCLGVCTSTHAYEAHQTTIFKQHQRPCPVLEKWLSGLDREVLPLVLAHIDPDELGDPADLSAQHAHICAARGHAHRPVPSAEASNKPLSAALPPAETRFTLCEATKELKSVVYADFMLRAGRGWERVAVKDIPLRHDRLDVDGPDAGIEHAVGAIFESARAEMVLPAGIRSDVEVHSLGIDSRETVLGRLLAESMLKWVREPERRTCLQVDVALLNGRAVRGDIDEGELKVSHFWDMLPYVEPVALANVKARELAAILERSALQATQADPAGASTAVLSENWFLQCAGVHIGRGADGAPDWSDMRVGGTPWSHTGRRVWGDCHVIVAAPAGVVTGSRTRYPELGDGVQDFPTNETVATAVMDGLRLLCGGRLTESFLEPLRHGGTQYTVPCDLA